MKRIVAFLSALILLFVSACAGPVEEVQNKEVAVKGNMVQGGRITVSARRPDTFNPLATNFESLRELMYLFYDGLFTLEEDFKVKENLVSSYSVSEDCLTVRINLREGINFADGSTLDAHDVTYSVEFIKENGGSFSGCVKNISEITATGTMSVMIKLFSPEADFASMLTFPIIKDGTPALTDSPNGTGQFIAERENIGYTDMLCKKNPSYHLGRPYIDEIRVLYMNTDIKAETSFLSGETDIFINPGFDSEEKLNGNIKVYESGSNKFEFLGFNSAKGLFADDSARQAIFSACDKVALEKEFREVKTTASTPVNPAAFFYSEEIDEVTVGDVTEILTRNGWHPGGTGVYEKDGKSFSFTIIVNGDDSVRVGIANYLSHCFLSYGISADVEILSYQKYKDRLTAGDYDAFVGGCTIGNAANYGFLIGSGGSANVMGYSGGVMDMRIAALAQAKGENIGAEAKKFGKAMSESAPLVGFYFRTTKIYTKENVVIPQISPTGVYVNAYKWFLV